MRANYLGARASRRESEPSGVRQLPLDGTLRVRPGPGGVALRALDGCVLVTQEGDPADHVLGAGDALRLGGRGLVVAWALEASRLELEAPPRTLGVGAPGFLAADGGARTKGESPAPATLVPAVTRACSGSR